MGFSPLVVLIAVGVYGLLHSLLASEVGKRYFRSIFGGNVDRFYRLGFNILAVLTFLPVLGLLAILPDRQLYRIPSPWLFLMLAGQGFAIVALLIGLLQTGAGHFLGLRQILSPTPTAPPKLNASGLYRYVRHPLYSAGLLFIWLTPLLTMNLLALNLALTVYIVVGAYFEERRLVTEFGEAYIEYRQHTPMLLPRIQARKDLPR